MNSKSLQEHFPDIYKDFFVQNDLIISWCYVFPWSPLWWKHMSHHIRTKSKIPIKCYVWFKKIKNNKVTFKWVDFFDVSEKKFIKNNFHDFIKEDVAICSILENFLKDNSLDFWVEISILSETPRWHSFWFSGTSFAILATWFYILWNLLDKKVLLEYNNFLASKELNDIYNLALSLELKSRHWNTIWQNIMNTLSNYKEPTVFFTEKFNPETKNEAIEKLFKKHIPINSLSDEVVTKDLLIDCLMVFSWISSNSTQVEQFKKADNKELDKYKDYLDNNVIWAEWKNKDIFLKDFMDNIESTYDYIADIVWILNIKSIHLFQEMLEKWYKEDLIEDFICHINKYRYILALIENQSSFAEDFIFYFSKNRLTTNEKVWIMPTSSWKLWWWYVVVTKPWISRNTIDKTIEELKTIYPNVEIEYSSYLDWECSDWVIVEQYISEWIYSKYVDKNKLIFKSNKWDNYIWDYSEIVEKEKDGLILDMINNKIYLNWEKLTSKDIPSQNTTIEMLTKLLENLWEEVSNKEFPISSYSNNKNEMLWKIIIPLLRLIEERTKEQLSITCKWSLSEFFIRMSDINLKIGVVKRI